MSNELQTKLDAILLDKNTNLLPENLKAGVTCLGIEGDFKEKAKLFETIEEMNNSVGNEDGTMAIIYRNESYNWNGTSGVVSFLFPKTVTLTESATGNCYGELMSDVYVSMYGSVSATGANFEISTMDKTYYITYTSEDGLMYTRTDSEDDVVPISNESVIIPMSTWSNVCGFFIQSYTPSLKGLYKNTPYENTNKLLLSELSSFSFNEDKTSTINQIFLPNWYDVSKLKSLANKLYTELSITSTSISVFADENDDLYFAVLKNTSDGTFRDFSAVQHVFDNSFNFLGYTPWYTNDSWVHTAYVYKLDLENQTYEVVTENMSYSGRVNYSTNDSYYYYYFTLPFKTIGVSISLNQEYVSDWCRTFVGDESSVKQTQLSSLTRYVTDYEFRLAPTQFDAAADNLFAGAKAYGATGEITGTLSENPSSNFDDGNILMFDKLQTAYDEMPIVVLADGDTVNANIKIIPTKSTGESLIDFSQLTDASGIFAEHSNIQKLPYINTTNATNMYGMFRAIYGNLTYIKGIDFTNTESTSMMFYQCMIPELNFEFNMPKVLNTSNMFGQSTKLTKMGTITIPLATNASSMFWNTNKLVEINMQETGNVTNFYQMCYNCLSLTTINQMNMASATSVTQMFKQCTALSEESLNNILASLISATAYTGTKTLAEVGLTEEQATICTGLSNYTAFTAAGWTTGY